MMMMAALWLWWSCRTFQFWPPTSQVGGEVGLSHVWLGEDRLFI